MALDRDWRGPQFVFNKTYLRLQEHTYTKVEKVANLLSRLLHGDDNHYGCQHCIDTAQLMMPELEKVFKNGSS